MSGSAATDSSSDSVARKEITSKAKRYIIGYPLFWLGIVFLIPIAFLIVVSFNVNVPGGSYEFGFTLENYQRFFDVQFLAELPPFDANVYLEQFWVTIQIAILTAVISLIVGYPVAYCLARMKRAWLRNVLLVLIVSSLWITYVIRAYAWQVILASGGVLSTIGEWFGILSEPQSFYPGYWGLIIGMVYVFMPFMILTLYSSIKRIDDNLLEASKNLGAGPVQTFRRVTLPLSKNGIVGGISLVFVLALGAYVMPRLLGSAGERTLPVLIEAQVMGEQNYPFAAAMSIGLVFVVLAFLWLVVRFTGITAVGLGGGTSVDTANETDRKSTDRRKSNHDGLLNFIAGSLSYRIGLLLDLILTQIYALVSVISAQARERLIWLFTRLFMIFAVLFIAVPLVIIIAVSFTPQDFLTFPPGGFSLRWYIEFFTDPSWVTALLNSLGIAAGAAVLSTSIGGALAFALDRYEYNWNTLIGTLGILPILVPPVIVGVAFLSFFLQLGLTGSRTGIIITHGIFYSPFPFILISQGLDELDRTYEEAAMDLGASTYQTIRTVTYPLIQANVVSGALFAFILSLNEYIIAWLLSLFLVDTIPIQLFNSLRYGYTPVIAAASVVFIIITVITMTGVNRMSGGIWE